MTPVGPVTVTDALLLLILVFCDICSSSLSLSFESLYSIIISNFHNYFQDGRVDDQRGIIIEERGKTIDIIFIDAKQDGGRKDISSLSIIITNCMH